MMDNDTSQYGKCRDRQSHIITVQDALSCIDPDLFHKLTVAVTREE